MARLTIADLFALRGERQLTEVFTMSPEEATACDEAGIDMIVTPAGNVKRIRQAAPNVFLVGGLVGAYGASEEKAVSAGYETLNDGADAVYTNASLLRVEQMAREWIPVIGHVGFVPYRASWLGGHRAVGKTAAEAKQVYDHAKRYEEAGAIGVEMEVVPYQVAAEIAKRVNLLIISMGSGSGGDAQYLFAEDILGTNRGHYPRHAKTYRNLRAELDRIQRERVAAFQEFKADVEGGAYPEKRHTVEADPAEHEKFVRSLEEQG